MSGILIWAEQAETGSALTTASLEALHVGRLLAERCAEPLIALVIGAAPGDAARAAIAAGADVALTAEGAALADYRLTPYAAILEAAVAQESPHFVLAPGSVAGRELIGYCAAGLDAALLEDLIALDVDAAPAALRGTHPSYAGKVLATVEARGPLQMATLRPRAFTPAVPDKARSGAIRPIAAPVDAAAIPETIEAKAPTAESISLTDARIVVSGGRGLGGPSGFEPLRALAQALGGAVGASRAVVDAGWIPYTHQVGQTGKTVSPDLYIAVGISGAVQHQAGMRTSKTIVAINKDPNAPIFQIAQYGVVADLNTFIPALIRAVREQSPR